MNIISLGGGVQSSAMLLMALDGYFEDTPDVAIFADTQWEPSWVYNWLAKLEELVKPFPIIRVTNGDIRESQKGRTVSMPYYLKGPNGKAGMNRRQCTYEFKLKPIKRWVRENCKHAFMWIGISTDEAIRMKPSQVKYITNTFPLIDKNLSRTDCAHYLMEKVGEVPNKSACIGCPYHNNDYWNMLKTMSPEEYEQACLYDLKIRHNPKMIAEQYLHRSLLPLDSAVNIYSTKTLVDAFGNECEGLCGV